VPNRSEHQFLKKSIHYFAFLRDKLKHERAKHCASNVPFLLLKIVCFVIAFSLRENQEHSFRASFAAMIDQTLFFFASYLNSTVGFWWMPEIKVISFALTAKPPIPSSAIAQLNYYLIHS